MHEWNVISLSRHLTLSCSLVKWASVQYHRLGLTDPPLCSTNVIYLHLHLVRAVVVVLLVVVVTVKVCVCGGGGGGRAFSTSILCPSGLAARQCHTHQNLICWPIYCEHSLETSPQQTFSGRNKRNIREK